jgi:hypothetical protein
VERRDDWCNLAQHLVQCALFFHPAIWWISAKLALEREIACDDHVLEASGRPRAYALTLANVASRMNQCRRSLAPGVSNNNSQLQQRITMILNTRRDHSPRLAKSRLGLFTTTAALLAVLTLVAGPRLVLAQSQPAAPATPANPAAQNNSIDAIPPETPVAEEPPATLPPDLIGDESDPRSKSGQPGAIGIAPVPSPQFVTVAPPAPGAPLIVSTVPVAPMAPMPPMAAVAPVPSVGLPPGAPATTRAAKKHLTIEERLDRLERILQNRGAWGGTTSFSSSGGSGGGSAPAYAFVAPPGGSSSSSSGVGHSYGYAITPSPNSFSSGTGSPYSRPGIALNRAADEGAKAAEDAKRAVESAQRELEQAMRETGNVRSKDLERLQEKLRDSEARSSLRELQALRDARESLQKEMETLEKQIKRLEESQSPKNKTMRGRLHDPDEDPKTEDAKRS